MLTSPKTRLTLLCLSPILLSGAILAAITFTQTQAKVTQQSEQFSKVLTSYLAMTSGQYLLSEDLLGINVVLNQMQRDGVLEFASIYDLNDQLVAQVGKPYPGAAVFSQQITFQDSTAGYIQVGYAAADLNLLPADLLTTIFVVFALLGLGVVCLIYLSADLLSLWVFGAPKTQPEMPSVETEEPELQMPEYPHGALLVMRLEPLRLNRTYRSLIFKAITLHGGKVLDESQDDLNVQFRKDDAAFSSVCAGLVIQRLVEQIGPPVKLKLALHWSENVDQEADLKHASYLASLSNQAVLISKDFANTLADDLASYEPYRNSLAPDGAVFQIISVANGELLNRQADQILAQSQ